MMTEEHMITMLNIIVKLDYHKGSHVISTLMDGIHDAEFDDVPILGKYVLTLCGSAGPFSELYAAHVMRRGLVSLKKFIRCGASVSVMRRWCAARSIALVE